MIFSMLQEGVDTVTAEAISISHPVTITENDREKKKTR